jgi:hypothetical protein
MGCSFVADNKGSFLTFPTFILPVDDSSDCTISGQLEDSPTAYDFDSRLVGSIFNLHNQMRFRKQHHPISSKTLPKIKAIPPIETYPMITPAPPSSTDHLTNDIDLSTINEDAAHNKNNNDKKVVLDPFTSTL